MTTLLLREYRVDFDIHRVTRVIQFNRIIRVIRFVVNMHLSKIVKAIAYITFRTTVDYT